jgi:alkylated DNA nucleotide flippase Atl1
MSTREADYDPSGEAEMSYRKKTWREKLADKEGYPKVLMLEKGFPCYKAVHKMGAEAGDEIVLVNPSEVVTLMKQIPYGKVTTIVEICQAIAERHQVNGCCSLTTGIFIMTAANAAEEAKSENTDLGIPYWRTLKTDGMLNEKFPGGTEAQKAHLEAEWLTVVSKGKRFQVKDYQSYLVKSY